jgi:glycosyltransferase involved in cell wall biosynthesis
MALGLPVVASDIPAHRETLGPVAALVEASEPALAKRLAEVLADGELRAQLGAENPTRARSEQDDRAMVTALEGLYGELLPL